MLPVPETCAIAAGVERSKAMAASSEAAMEVRGEDDCIDGLQ